MTTRSSLNPGTIESLIRLAGALDTSVDELLLHAPPDWSQAAGIAPPVLMTLDDVDCQALLRSAGQIALGSPS